MKNQHTGKWAEHEEVKKSWDCTSRMDECNQFFVKNAGKKSSSVTGHFDGSQPRSLGTGDLSAKPTVFVFTNNTTITFRCIQGSTTLVSQQNAAFERLVATFIEDVRIQGPLTSEEIALLEPATYVCSG
jgi:hypothetical protein